VIAYIDASVLLRVILRQKPILSEWDELHAGVSSTLLRAECFRALDQLWHRHELDENELAAKRTVVADYLSRIAIIPIDDQVIEITTRSLPSSLATLDAIHLASAMIYRDAQPEDEPPIFMATHDQQLAKTARMLDFRVIGSP